MNKLPTTKLEKEALALMSKPTTSWHDLKKYLRKYVKDNYPFIK